MRAAARCGVLAALALAGCAGGGPRVVEVSPAHRTHTVAIADQDVFLRSRAAGYRVSARALPPAQQRQEVLVRWVGDAVAQVTLEYRQAGVTSALVRPVSYEREHVFVLPAGTVPLSAWRVALQGSNGERLAEKQSALW